MPPEIRNMYDVSSNKYIKSWHHSVYWNTLSLLDTVWVSHINTKMNISVKIASNQKNLSKICSNLALQTLPLFLMQSIISDAIYKQGFTDLKSVGMYPLWYWSFLCIHWVYVVCIRISTSSTPPPTTTTIYLGIDFGVWVVGYWGLGLCDV